MITDEMIKELRKISKHQRITGNLDCEIKNSELAKCIKEIKRIVEDSKVKHN